MSIPSAQPLPSHWENPVAWGYTFVWESPCEEIEKINFHSDHFFERSVEFEVTNQAAANRLAKIIKNDPYWLGVSINHHFINYSVIISEPIKYQTLLKILQEFSTSKRFMQSIH